MLAKILKEMWVEPEVLEALGEEQKRILFIKMREEQVRRWREREEGGGSHAGRRKVSGKHVTWLLGRDGDVSVSVIGGAEDFRSCELLRSLLGNRIQNDRVTGIQTAASLPKHEIDQRSNKHHVQLPPANGHNNESLTPKGQLPEEETDSGSAEEDPRDVCDGSEGESGSSTDNLNNWAPLYRPHPCNLGNRPLLKSQLSGTDGTHPQDRVTACRPEEEPAYGGRVAHLKRTFASGAAGSDAAARGRAKPPVAVKPAHLQTAALPRGGGAVLAT